MKNLASSLLPGFLLAAVLIFLLHFEPFSRPDEARDGYLLELKVAAEHAAPMRLFYDRGQGFRLRESSGGVVAASPEQTVRFALPAGWFRMLRVEGGPGFAGFEVQSARVVDLEGVERAQIPLAIFRGQFPADGVVPQPGRTRVAHGATIVFPQPLVLAPPIAWGDTLWQTFLGTLLLALVFWKWGSRFDGALTRGAASLRSYFVPRPALAIFLATAGAVLIACHPVIFLDRSYVSPNNGALVLSAESGPGPVEDIRGSDTGAVMWAHLPYSVVEQRAILQDHEWPLWNRFNMCGSPLLGQGQSMIGDPLHWITIVAGGAAWAWDLKFVLARLAFAFGIGLLVRAVTGRLLAAVLLGISAAFIGFYGYRLNHPACFSLGYGPWILLAWWQLARAAGWRAGVPAALLLLAANWCELNSGTAKESAMLLLGLNGSGVLALGMMEKDLGMRLRKFLLAGSSLLLFLLISAPCWMVFLDALSRAFTTSGKPPVYQIPPAILLGLFDELFYRQTAPMEFHSNPAANFLVLLGVLWALAARRLRRDTSWWVLILSVAPVVALVFGLVPALVIEKLPFIRNLSHVDNTFSCVLIVLLFPLAGFGLSACVDSIRTARWRQEYWLALLFLGGLAALFFGQIQAHPRVGSGPASTPAYPETSDFFRGYAVALFIALAVLPLALRSLSRRAAVTPLLVGILAFSTLHFRHGMYGSTKFDTYVVNPGQRVDLPETTSSIAALRKMQTEPERVLGIDYVLAPGYSAALGLESPGSADALLSPYWRQLIDAAGIPLIWGWRMTAASEDLPKKQKFFDMLNVRHYLAMPATPRPPTLKSLGTADLEVLVSPTVWPRAFFTDRLPRYRDVAEFAQWVAEGDGRPFAAAAEGEANAPALPAELGARKVEPASAYRLTSNTTEFVVEAPGPGVVVLSEAHEAGCFRVSLNGERVAPFRVNHLFHGVSIPQAGRYVIRFAYEPPVWKRALTLAAAGILLLLGALAAVSLTAPGRRLG